MKTELGALAIIVTVLLACGPHGGAGTYVLSPEQASHPSRIDQSRVVLPDGKIGYAYECQWPVGCMNNISEFCSKRTGSQEYEIALVTNSPIRPSDKVGNERRFAMALGCSAQSTSFAQQLCLANASSSIQNEEAVNRYNSALASEGYRVVTFLCKSPKGIETGY